MLDLSAAFDTIDHDILLSRLCNVNGITGDALDLFRSYLSGRIQRVVIEDAVSIEQELGFGVPQGSVVGPIIYCMYTKPVSDTIQWQGLSYHSYADDTYLYMTMDHSNNNWRDGLARIQLCVSEIRDWMNQNVLKLNDDKTELIVFTSEYKQDLYNDLSITIGDTVVDCSSQVKDLGVIFNRVLSLRTQHRPICVTVHPVIVPQPTPFRRRFNLRKAKWDDFSTDFDEAIEEVEPIPENYDRFIGLIRVVSRRHIPRGCRTNYIPGLTEESQSLYEAYKKQYTSNPFAEGTLETGNKLIDTMKEEKKKRWEEVITSIDLTHHSRKAWQTIKKLSNDPTSPNHPCLVNSNQVAHHLLVNGQGTMPTKPKCPALPTVKGKPSLVSAFSEEEYRKGIAALKNNKGSRHRRHTGGATKEPWPQSTQVVAHNA